MPEIAARVRETARRQPQDEAHALHLDWVDLVASVVGEAVAVEGAASYQEPAAPGASEPPGPGALGDDLTLPLGEVVLNPVADAGRALEHGWVRSGQACSGKTAKRLQALG